MVVPTPALQQRAGTMLVEATAVGAGQVGVNVPSLTAMDDPVTGTVLFVGVLTGLLLVSFLVGRELTEGSSDAARGTSSPPDRSTETTSNPTYRSRPTPTVEWDDPAEDGDLEDDERIISLLEEADGQLRQSRIVSETGWSKTKVSRTLSGLADDGDVVKIQLGRENLICLPEQVPSIGTEEDR